jgi:hypothetical protein
MVTCAVVIGTLVSVGMSAPIRPRATAAWRKWQEQAYHPAPPPYAQRN